MRYDRRPRFYSVLLCLLAGMAGYLLASGLASGGVKVATTLTGEEAMQHLQETNTVCATVASARYVESAQGSPTYLNLDRPYPKQTCAAVIMGSARAKFKVAPETAFKEKHVCITGFITTNSFGKAQITVEDPSQIVITEPPPAATNQTGVVPGQ